MNCKHRFPTAFISEYHHTVSYVEDTFVNYAEDWRRLPLEEVRDSIEIAVSAMDG